MMKRKNCFRMAALVLAVMMALCLAACGGSGAGGQSQNSGDSEVQVFEPLDSESVNIQTEPVATESQYYSAIWISFDRDERIVYDDILIQHDDYVLVYDFEWDYMCSSYYLQYVYEYESLYDGNELTFSAYGADGAQIYKESYIPAGDWLIDADGIGVDYKLISVNAGLKGDLVGEWMDIIPSNVGDIKFYNDGTIDDRGFVGQYRLISRFGMPAIEVYDDDGRIRTIYKYEFLETNLLAIYEADEDKYLNLFYRHPYDPNEE